MSENIVKASVITGVINAAINGGIQYFLLKNKAPIKISVDSITNNEHTVLGASVVLALILALILTLVGYFTMKKPRVPFFPTAVLLTLKHGFFTFGVVVTLSVMWQRYMGTVEVSLLTAVVLIGVIAGLASGIVKYMTYKACIIREKADEADQLIPERLSTS